jgi:hypothetical protein
MKGTLAILLLVAVAVPRVARADDGWVDRWLEMVRQTQAEQPRWVSPIVTVSGKLDQSVRYDVFHQDLAGGATAMNFGAGRGVEVIPQRNLQVQFIPPSYLTSTDPKLRDGFGDTSFRIKYRIVSRNEEGGNYILSAYVLTSLPTGSYRNGAASAVVTPFITAGKGLGKFVVQSAFGVGLPVDDVHPTGHALSWNTAFQYNLGHFLWPEVEVNSTFWKGGTLDGKKQVFLTPGLSVGKIAINRQLALTFGTAMQIAATRFHKFDHNLILSSRLSF